MKNVAVIALGALAALSASAEDCKFSKDHAANVDGPAKRVVVAAGAGELIVRGEEGRTAVNASGRACASSQELLDEMKLETRREGDTVYIRTLMPSWNSGMFGLTRYAHLDLTVLAPEGATMSIEDSSGALQLSKVQSASVADSSGDQSIRDIAGDLDVTDSSGGIEIERVGGTLKLKDSSGDVHIDEVRGNVEISVDSSGDLEIERIAGAVHIANDSSGDIEIADVQRDVTIESDSSGSISVDGVGGDFIVGSDGSGRINHERVLGAVRIPDKD